MLPLRPTASNWIKFLLLLALALLIAVIVQGDQGAREKTYRQQLEKEKQELIERDKEQNKRLNKLERDVKKLKTSKVNSPKKSPPKQAAVTYPINCEAYRPLVEKYNWNVNVAMAVMYAESGCNPNAVSPTNDHGLFQLHGIPIYNPAQNVAYAYHNKYMQGGWSHWVVCTRGIVRCW
jgi:hypothetical protein